MKFFLKHLFKLILPFTGFLFFGLPGMASGLLCGLLADTLYGYLKSIKLDNDILSGKADSSRLENQNTLSFFTAFFILKSMELKVFSASEAFFDCLENLAGRSMNTLAAGRTLSLIKKFNGILDDNNAETAAFYPAEKDELRRILKTVLSGLLNVFPPEPSALNSFTGFLERHSIMEKTEAAALFRLSEHPDPCKVLGVKNKTDKNEIQKNYRLLAAAFHPDKNLALDDEKQKKLEEAFIRVNRAYRELMDKSD